MTMIQIDLPEATAKAAREAGLLTSAALDREAACAERWGDEAAALQVAM